VKRVAVLGGGPAGAIAAHQLAQAGIETFVLDEKLAWEKPCGGGVTYKAYHQYPFLLHNDTPKRFVTRSLLATPAAGTAELNLTEPLLIYSRYHLNNMLLQRAAAAGAKIEKTRVLDASREDNRWRLRTRDGELDADYCIVATGARNPLRNLGTVLQPNDTMLALGYYVPGTQAHVDIQFYPQFEGYIWVFPRDTHLSVGIGGKGESAQNLRARLESYMREKQIDYSGATFYSHLLPSLATSSWKSNRVAGDGWMAVGDAAGLVDPITGEGLYYAIRSADLATAELIADRCPVAELATAYRRKIWHDFGDDLLFGAHLAHRVFLGNYLFREITTRMVEFMKLSPVFLDIVEDLFSGTQSYASLKRRLLSNFPAIHAQVLLHALSRKWSSSVGMGNASA
jgi:geranylgeranyl reductase family protein